MKKMFTMALAFSVFSTVSVFAQSGHSREVILGQSKNTIMAPRDDRNDRNRLERDKAAQIDKINREFDLKIAQVQRNRWMKNGEKKRQLRDLEAQRRQQLEMVNQRYAHMDHSNRRY